MARQRSTTDREKLFAAMRARMTRPRQTAHERLLIGQVRTVWAAFKNREHCKRYYWERKLGMSWPRIVRKQCYDRSYVEPAVFAVPSSLGSEFTVCEGRLPLETTIIRRVASRVVRTTGSSATGDWGLAGSLDRTRIAGRFAKNAR
jgi:hypothetical protein